MLTGITTFPSFAIHPQYPQALQRFINYNQMIKQKSTQMEQNIYDTLLKHPQERDHHQQEQNAYNSQNPQTAFKSHTKGEIKQFLLIKDQQDPNFISDLQSKKVKVHQKDTKEIPPKLDYQQKGGDLYMKVFTLLIMLLMILIGFRIMSPSQQVDEQKSMGLQYSKIKQPLLINFETKTDTSTTVDGMNQLNDVLENYEYDIGYHNVLEQSSFHETSTKSKISQYEQRKIRQRYY